MCSKIKMHPRIYIPPFLQQSFHPIPTSISDDFLFVQLHALFDNAHCSLAFRHLFSFIHCFEIPSKILKKKYNSIYIHTQVKLKINWLNFTLYVGKLLLSYYIICMWNPLSLVYVLHARSGFSVRGKLLYFLI